MENGAKALLIAGGMLIALLVIGLLVFMSMELTQYFETKAVEKQTSQVAEFNNQYMPYEDKDITIMELKSLYNKIMSNNEKFPHQEITITVPMKDNLCERAIYDSCLGVDEDKTTVTTLLAKSFSDISEEIKMGAVFKCTGIGYDDEGRVNKIIFEDITGNLIPPKADY